MCRITIIFINGVLDEPTSKARVLQVRRKLGWLSVCNDDRNVNRPLMSLSYMERVSGIL